MVLVVGEVLLDVFPDYSRIGGAPLNFAFHLKQLGVPVRFLSRVGRDPAGDRIRAFLQRHGFDLADVPTDDHYPTGQVEVHMDSRGGHQFHILPERAYDFLSLEKISVANPPHPLELIYFGSLIQRTPHGFRQVQDLLHRKNKNIKSFYDINLRPDCYSDEILEVSLHQADILKLNHEELDVVGRRLDGPGGKEALIDWIMQTYDIELMALTRGSGGSELITEDQHVSHTPPSLDRVLDTVGTGDGYAAILAMGYLYRWPLDRILQLASTFAAQICRIPGAVPEDDSFYTQIKSLLEGDTHGQ